MILYYVSGKGRKLVCAEGEEGKKGGNKSFPFAALKWSCNAVGATT